MNCFSHRRTVANPVFFLRFFRMITALPVPSVKVFHKTYYHEKGQRIGNSQPGSPLTDNEAVLALMDKDDLEYYFCGKVTPFFNIQSLKTVGRTWGKMVLLDKIFRSSGFIFMAVVHFASVVRFAPHSPTVSKVTLFFVVVI